MLSNPIFDRARQLRLQGFLKALEEQINSNSYNDMSFLDRISFLLDREILERDNKSLSIRLSKAKFKENGCIEDIYTNVGRGIDKSKLIELAQCNWIKQKRNIIITGASGSGKSYLASAIAHHACLLGYSVRYFRLSNLLIELENSKLEGRYIKTLDQFKKQNIIIFDDFCLSALTETEEKNLFELIEERHNINSTIITSQNPISSWHDLMPNSAIADAILDRIVHNAERISLEGDSLRKDKKV